MSWLPQYVVGTCEGRWIGKMLLGHSYPHSRHKVLLRSHWRRASRVSACLSGEWGASLQEACMRVEVPGCSRACVRNKNIPGFTTDYKDLVKRLPQLVVLS